MNTASPDRKNRVAQWAFDTKAILGRFHIWLDDVEVAWVRGQSQREFTSHLSFLSGAMERQFAMTGALTALGTRLFGRFGEGASLGKAGINQVKKDADAISAYVMSECLWYLTRQVPENHAVMVSLGEGLMPKAGETPEMGSNPQLGFGRVYARPEVAKWLDQRVVRLLNDPSYRWTEFYKEIREAGITIWGAAIDTLENTSRFAKGDPSGPMTVLHVFDQPLRISRPYEGYMGSLLLPKEIVSRAEEDSILIDYRTPRALVWETIRKTYPGIEPQNVHVWTLRGKSRAERIGGLWREWEALRVHIIDDGWTLPQGMAAFTESGTYAPTYGIGAWKDEAGKTHLFLCDGYAASAEAMQAASLAPLLGLRAFLSVFTSSFKLPYDKENALMRLDPAAPDFPARLAGLLGRPADQKTVDKHRAMILEAVEAGIPLQKSSIGADDFFPEKDWDVLAVTGYMNPDPYTGAAGVEKLAEDCYRVRVRLSSRRGEELITMTLKLKEPLDQSRFIFNPLLTRFMSGEDYETRAVRISDSGRIRNELQTLCSEALEFRKSGAIRVHFARIPTDVISRQNQIKLLDILSWYKKNHPIWFSWLEIAPPGS
ncbi:MAG: hypothetical protein ABSA30_03405 [Candidatus Aminicenantales bacterium]|jgi:hypothetical protein